MSFMLMILLAGAVIAVAILASRLAGGLGSALEDPEKLANLLVHEIKLYNEDLVVKGREDKAIYAYLRDDIERSRAMYEERLGDEAASHFDDALVRILAGGDRSAMGD